MQRALIAAFVGTALAAAPHQARDDCATQCWAAYQKCSGAPDANPTHCGEQLTGCVGYNPFGADGQVVQPTECQHPPSVTGDACSHACWDSYSKCLKKPDANPAHCGEQLTGCVGYSPFGADGSVVRPTKCEHEPRPTGDACSHACWDAFNKCRSKPDANMAVCADQIAGCVGYNPFGQDGSITEPTACSHTSMTASTTAAPTTTAPPQHDDCAWKCYDEYNKCRGAPDANFAVCGAGYAKCLGYNPFNDGGSLVTPTACSHTTAAPTTTAAPEEECHIKLCTDKYDKCRGKPHANFADCGADYAKCLGFNPFDKEGELTPVEDCYHHKGPGNHTGPPPVITPVTPPVKPVTPPVVVPPVVVSGAGYVQPMNILAMLAAGVAALL